MLALTLLFVACTADPEVQDSDTGSVDTQPVDTGSPPADTWAMTLVSEDPTLSVVVFDFAVGASGVEGVSLLDGGALGTGSLELSLPAVDPTLLQPFSADAPEVGARYGLALSFVDDNGNGSPDVGETLVGGLDYTLLYLDAPSSVMEFLGFRRGWNAFRSVGGFTEVVDLQGLSLSPSLAVVERMDLSGTYDLSVGPARAAVLPAAWFADPGVVEAIGDVALAETWSMSLEGAPPSSHVLPITDPVLPGGALDLPFAYLDNNGNGRWTLGQDQPVLPMCWEGQMALALWLPEPPDAESALTYLALGIAPGWALGQQSETGLDFLGAQAYGGLSFAADCSF